MLKRSTDIMSAKYPSLNRELQFQITCFDKKTLTPCPIFRKRKGDIEYAQVPISQTIEDIMMFIQEWSYRERHITTRLTMNILKRKMAELQWAYKCESEMLYK
jgi:hypothetical protein